MKSKLSLLVYLAMISSTTLFADVSIPFGEGAGKVDYLNYKRFPRLEDPTPTGPLSFRVVGDKIWVADSVGNKLMQFGKDGKFISEFSILPEKTKPYELSKFNLPLLNSRIEDIAPVLDEKGEVVAWWVAEICHNKLFKFSPDGKKLAEIDSPDLKQPYRIEVGKGGHIFVADKMARAIFTFDADGKFMNELNWEWSGMAVSGPKDTLYRLMYDKEARRNILIASNLKGKVIRSRVIDYDIPMNPILWWVDEEKGECVISFNQPKFEGKFNILRVDLEGKVLGSGEMPAPLVMNRYIDYSNGNVFIGKGNFLNAPEEKFEVVPFKLP